jgi:hypothetical protein
MGAYCDCNACVSTLCTAFIKILNRCVNVNYLTKDP